jgi:hypothetical protein
MGHRCNLVAKRGGGVEVYYSHWGALGLLADLLKGPSSIADWLKDCTRDEQLIDNVFSEGIALADFDDQLLLLRGGVMIQHILPLRLAYLEMLRAGWPGWRVEWADRGVLDVAQHVGLPTIGLDLKPLVCPSDAKLRKPGHVGSFSWVTVVGDVTEDFAFGLQPGELMLVGPRLLDYCKERVAGQLPVEDNLGGGLLLKPAARSLGWWSGGDLRPAAADVAAAWPGWQIRELPEALRDQVAGSGRDPSAYSLSAERIRTFIADELFPAVEHDPVASMRRLEARLREAGDEPTVSPEALKYSRPK